MILAGGEGRRLGPLTADRAKPAVSFGGRYRIIDIVLSNFVNSGLHRIKVLTQYKSASLEEHIARAWRLSPMLHAYWAAQMDLVAVQPAFNLYNRHWPIRTGINHDPPAKFVFRDEATAHIGIATESLVSHGCIISGGRIHRSVLSNRVRVNSFSEIEESVLFENVVIGQHVKIRKAIIDKDVEIPAGTEIGYDLQEDRKRRFVSDEGITVIPKRAKI